MLHQICILRAFIEQEYLSKNEKKKSVSEAFNKNVNFSTGFQY